MNDSPFTKVLPSSKSLSDLFGPENVDRAIEILKTPAAIAVIASVGIHGLLGVSLPVLSSKDAAVDSHQKTTKLIDLTPSEQSRLPQSTSAITFPPLQNVLPNSTTLPDPLSGNLFKPLPDPSLNLFSPPNTSTTPNTRPSTSTRTSTTTTTTTTTTPTYDFSRYFLGTPLPALTPGQPLVTPPTPTPTPSPQSDPTQGATNTPLPPGATGPTPTTTPSPGPTPAATPTATPGLAQIEAERKARALLAYQITAQMQAFQTPGGAPSDSPEDILTRYNTWRSAIIRTGAASMEDLQRESVAYTKLYPDDRAVTTLPCQTDGCDDKSVIFVVAIAPDGKLLGYPGITKATGDKALDKAAQQLFETTLLKKLQVPPKEQRMTVYSVSVDFEKK
jgi:hypothetical protein